MPRDLRFDDVVHAYRWILGREPESLDVVGDQARVGWDIQGLRAILLNSPEFKHAFLNLEPMGPPRPIVAPPAHRLVFFHIPRSGGTTLHHMLTAAVGAERVSPVRHNNLWRCLASDLALARLFCGHYDRDSLAVIPGPAVKVATVLREPRARLVSLYDYLRAHRSEAIAPANLDLAQAARKYGLGDFLQAALEINPAAVDNACLRTFGGWLPYRRWEQAAEPSAPKTLADFGFPIEALVRRAEDFLSDMAAVGILEQFEESAQAIFTAFGLGSPLPVGALHSLESLNKGNETFEPVRPLTITRLDALRLDEMTRYDSQLYDHARTLLANVINAQAGREQAQLAS